MTGMWLISYSILWLLVVAEGVILVALARQIGVLHTRLGPTGARMINAGPTVGDVAPALEGTDLSSGRPLRLGAGRGKQTLLLFITPTCPSCGEMMPSLRTLAHSESMILDLILIGPEKDMEANRAFIRQHRLTNIPFMASTEAHTRYQIGITPYGILLDADFRVQAKGLVNNMTHLESLLNAADLGHASIQSFFQAEEAARLAAS